MSELAATLILIVVALLLIPVGVWIVRQTRRARRSMAPLAGMMLLLGAFFAADPPPPPPSESALPRTDENDEPKDRPKK